MSKVKMLPPEPSSICEFFLNGLPVEIGEHAEEGETDISIRAYPNELDMWIKMSSRIEVDGRWIKDDDNEIKATLDLSAARLLLAQLQSAIRLLEISKAEYHQEEAA